MDELYRDQILEHYKRPHNFGVVEGADLEYEDTNPFCGDEQHVTIKLDAGDKVSEVAFEGKGCAISTAATRLPRARPPRSAWDPWVPAAPHLPTQPPHPPPSRPHAATYTPHAGDE